MDKILGLLAGVDRRIIIAVIVLIVLSALLALLKKAIKIGIVIAIVAVIAIYGEKLIDDYRIGADTNKESIEELEGTPRD